MKTIKNILAAALIVGTLSVSSFAGDGIIVGDRGGIIVGDRGGIIVGDAVEQPCTPKEGVSFGQVVSALGGIIVGDFTGGIIVGDAIGGENDTCGIIVGD